MIAKLSRRSTHPPAADGDDLLAAALPDRVRIAQQRVAHQHDPALVQAYSERELTADRQLAEQVRDFGRRERLARMEAAASAAERVRRTSSVLAEREAADLLRASQAIAEQRHAASPHAKVARLHRRKPLVLGILTTVVVFAMLFSAVTVQRNIIPNGSPSNLLWWLSYGLETLISGMLIALMLSTSDTAEFGVIESKATAYGIEGLLLTVTVTLNIYPYAHAKDLFNVGVHAIAPITIGAALATHRVVAGRYGRAIEVATAAVPAAEDLQVRLAALADVAEAHTRDLVAQDSDTVHPVIVHRAPELDTVQSPHTGTVHTMDSNHPAPVHTVHRAPDTGAVHGDRSPEPETMHPDTVHLDAAPLEETVQFPCTVEDTVHPVTVHRAPEVDEDVRSVRTVHTAQHTVEDIAAPDAGESIVQAIGQQDQGHAYVLTVHGETAGVDVTEQVRTAADSTVQHHAGAVHGEKAGHLDTVHPDAAPLEETVQFPCTVEDTVQPVTVHRAGEPDTVHPGVHTEQVTVQAETVHRAGEPVTEQRPVDDAELWGLAAEVHQRLRRTKFSVEDIARVLTAHRRHGLGADRIYRDKIGPHRETTARWLELAEEVERERTGSMAAVINLRG
ncbi:hypothetical protein [Nocardia sp. alder85J]|uniref:hypothetical protein n=1 Tax=Nocardia sp. alder85J TaxID=2862949 RepID=UPI001CD3B343|nr:hypothetical protein [Nocardia sp. alder85J]MCX4099264.1 hypothetical protein [Nocardia sp. alder85J]